MSFQQSQPPPYLVESTTAAVVVPPKQSRNNREFLAHLWAWRITLIMIFVPLFLLPLVFCFEYDPVLKNSMRCAYTLILMVILWTTEALPLSVTSLLPMVLYPLMSVVKATDLAPQYMSDSNMSFVGSILVIGAFERAGLHNRFALRILTLVGAQPRWLLAGFMFAAWCLSMCISNAMITVLFIPIVISVNTELQKAIKAAENVHYREQVEGVTVIAIPSDKAYVKDASNIEDNNNPKNEADPDGEKLPEYEKMLIIAVAYSATIGGCVTLIGASHNFIISSQIGAVFEAKGCTNPLNFLTWMAFSLPFATIYLIFAWLWLLIYFCGVAYTFGFKKSPIEKHRSTIEATIKDLYNNLPPFNNVEIVILGHCFVMILLLVTRQLNNDPIIGWEVIAEGYVKESTATVLVAVMLFFFPTNFPFRDQKTGKLVAPKPATNWKDAERSFPFGLILLVGGGMAAAYGAEVSGLATLVASLLDELVSGMTDFLAVLIIVIFMICMTQFMSNPACVTLMLPILKELAERRNSNPILFMFPPAMASSFSFMLPAAAPPIALVFETGRFHIPELLLVGFVVTMFGVGSIVFASTTYGAPVFNYYKLPWIIEANGTVTSCL